MHPGLLLLSHYMYVLRLYDLFHLAFSSKTLSKSDAFAGFDCKVHVIQQSLDCNDGTSAGSTILAKICKWAE